MTEIDRTDRPAILANVGDAALRRWILVFDYRRQIVDFRPGGEVHSIRDRGWPDASVERDLRR